MSESDQQDNKRGSIAMLLVIGFGYAGIIAAFARLFSLMQQI